MEVWHDTALPRFADDQGAASRIRDLSTLSGRGGDLVRRVPSSLSRVSCVGLPQPGGHVPGLVLYGRTRRSMAEECVGSSTFRAYQQAKVPPKTPTEP